VIVYPIVQGILTKSRVKIHKIDSYPEDRGRRREEHFHNSSLVKPSTDTIRGCLFEMQRNCFDIDWKFSAVKIITSPRGEFVAAPGGHFAIQVSSKEYYGLG